MMVYVLRAFLVSFCRSVPLEFLRSFFFNCHLMLKVVVYIQKLLITFENTLSGKSFQLRQRFSVTQGKLGVCELYLQSVCIR